MIDPKLFKELDVEHEDVKTLTDILNNDLNPLCAHLYYCFGMTKATKDACEAFYKLRIRIIEIAIRNIEKAKNSSSETISHPETVTRLAQCEAELEEACDAYGYFLTEGKIKEE